MRIRDWSSDVCSSDLRGGRRGTLRDREACACCGRTWRGRLTMSKANEADKKFESLAGPEKAAVVLLALGEERAAEVMGKLDEVELPTVTRAMSSFGQLSPDMIRDAAKALMERLSNGAAVSGGAMSSERMLSRFLPAARVSEIQTQLRGPARRPPWEPEAGRGGTEV